MCSIIWYTHFILFHLIKNILWSDQLWADFVLLQGVGICSLKNTALKYVWKMDGMSPKQSLTLTSSSESISTSLPLSFISPSVNMVEKRKLFKVKVLVFPMETDLLSPLCHYLPTVLFRQLLILWSHNENSSVMTPGERNTIGGFWGNVRWQLPTTQLLWLPGLLDFMNAGCSCCYHFPHQSKQAGSSSELFDDLVFSRIYF